MTIQKGFKNTKNVILVALLTLFLGTGILIIGNISPTQAAPNIGTNNEVCNDSGDTLCEVNIPDTKVSQGTVSAIMKIVFGVCGVLSVVFIAIGGFKYVVSGGDSSGLTSAKNTILYAIVGLVVSISAFILVQFVISLV